MPPPPGVLALQQEQAGEASGPSSRPSGVTSVTQAVAATSLEAAAPAVRPRAAASSGWIQGGYWSQSWGLSGPVLRAVASDKLAPTLDVPGSTRTQALPCVAQAPAPQSAPAQQT